MDDPTKALRMARAHKDPVERARALTELLNGMPALVSAIQRSRQEAIVEAHQGGIPYAFIGRKIGLSPSRTEQVSKGIFGGKTRNAQPTGDS